MNEELDALLAEIALAEGAAHTSVIPVEAVETACQQCRNSDLELCRYCRMERIRKEAGHG